MVKNLQKGKSAAAEPEPVEPISDAIIEKTLKFIKMPQVRDMVQVQKLICGRPQDMDVAKKQFTCYTSSDRKRWTECLYCSPVETINLPDLRFVV